MDLPGYVLPRRGNRSLILQTSYNRAADLVCFSNKGPDLSCCKLTSLRWDQRFQQPLHPPGINKGLLKTLIAP